MWRAYILTNMGVSALQLEGSKLLIFCLQQINLAQLNKIVGYYVSNGHINTKTQYLLSFQYGWDSLKNCESVNISLPHIFSLLDPIRPFSSRVGDVQVMVAALFPSVNMVNNKILIWNDWCMWLFWCVMGCYGIFGAEMRLSNSLSICI